METRVASLDLTALIVKCLCRVVFVPVGARFFTPVQTGLGPTQPPVQWVSFSGVKQSRCGVNDPPPSSAEVN
jgi:hypothetical protein